MQTSVLALVAALAISGTASGQTPPKPARLPAPPIVLPKAFAAYNQPEITNCLTVNANRTDCTVPAMTAGRYAIVVTSTATATGPDAKQAVLVAIGGRPCIGTAPAPFQGTASLRISCEVNLLTDTPLTVVAQMGSNAATPAAAGPAVKFIRLPWSGVISAKGGVVKPRAKEGQTPPKDKAIIRK